MLGNEADALIVFGRDGVTLWDLQGSLKFHPGVARLRLRRLDRGEMDDAFLRVAELREGERVLDCTLGLGQDALVAARAVGPKGRVGGVEKSLPLYAVVSEGLAAFDYGPKSCRVECVWADSGEYLAGLPPKAFDVVVFDPMFERPRGAQQAFEVVRRYAEYAPLSAEVLERAKRVAARCVVVKGWRYSREFKRLGIQPVLLSRFADVAWARVDAG